LASPKYLSIRKMGDMHRAILNEQWGKEPVCPPVLVLGTQSEDAFG
jgi:hypothetical protein